MPEIAENPPFPNSTSTLTRPSSSKILSEDILLGLNSLEEIALYEKKLLLYEQQQNLIWRRQYTNLLFAIYIIFAVFTAIVLSLVASGVWVLSDRVLITLIAATITPAAIMLTAKLKSLSSNQEK